VTIVIIRVLLACRGHLLLDFYSSETKGHEKYLYKLKYAEKLSLNFRSVCW